MSEKTQQRMVLAYAGLAMSMLMTILLLLVGIGCLTVCVVLQIAHFPTLPVGWAFPGLALGGLAVLFVRWCEYRTEELYDRYIQGGDDDE